MRFTWDPKKSAANLERRGFDFELAVRIFGGPTIEWEDNRRDYGERRRLAVGVAAGVLLTVCFTDRFGATGELERRIISARRSSRREQKTYADGREDR